MAESHSNHAGSRTEGRTLNANLVSLIFLLNFLLIGGGIVVMNMPATASPAESVDVASLVEPTEVAMITEVTPTTEPSPVASAVVATSTPPTVEDVSKPEIVHAGVADPVAGANIFSRSCSACHGFAAQGISGLGPGMIDNSFVNSLSDEELLTFIIVGRQVTDPANKTGVTMPARGGNPSLTDADLANVVDYIRSLNSDIEVVTEPATDVTDSVPRVAREFVPLSTTGLLPPRGDDETTTRSDDFRTAGEASYNLACAGCHGKDGEGILFFGSPLIDSSLVVERDGIAIFDLLTRGEPAADPRFGFVHPYRGGYPQLTDEQILQLIAHLMQVNVTEGDIDPN